MKKYADMNFVNEKLMHLRDKCGNEEMAFALNWALQMMRDIKTVDAVEVVRCKDCAYHDEVDEHELWCMGNGYPARLVTPDEYCSKGAPK